MPVPGNACINCGGTDYTLESGFYFCAECQVQSQDIREQVVDDYYGGRKIVISASQQTANTEKKAIATDKALTSWEIMNVVLRHLVDELILLGAPKNFKTVVLQLWTRYLMYSEAAFISKNVEKRPRLNLMFKRRDAEIIYGTRRKMMRAYRKPIARAKRARSDSSPGDESKSSVSSSVRTQKYHLTLKKKRLARAEYEHAASISSQESEITLESLSVKSPSNSSQKSHRLRYRKHTKEVLLDLLESAPKLSFEERESLQMRILKNESKSVDHLSMLKIFAILRLSLFITYSEIHLSDLLRWSEEGYFSLLNAEKFIPIQATLCKDIKRLFIKYLSSKKHINECVIQMSSFLGVPTRNLEANILPLIERYCIELHLPIELYTLIKKFLTNKSSLLTLTPLASYEGKALSYLLFILKCLFGLNGVTENELSKEATLLNRRENVNGRQERAFVWRNWAKFINCRNALLSLHHQPTKNAHFPSSRFGGSHAFLSRWEKIPIRHTLVREQRAMDKSIVDSMKRHLQEFYEKPNEPMCPSLTPLSSGLSNLLREKNKPNPKLTPRTRQILEDDFILDSLHFLINRQEDLYEKDECSFKHPLFKNKFIKVISPKLISASAMKPSRRKDTPLTVHIHSHQKPTHYLSESFGGTRFTECNMVNGVLPSYQQLTACCDEEYEDESFTRPNYWVYHGSFSNSKVMSSTFEYIAQSVFPTDFLWLLNQASHIGRIQSRDLYFLLCQTEKEFLNLGHKT